MKLICKGKILKCNDVIVNNADTTLLQDVFDSIFINSITYSSGDRAEGSEYRFNYSGKIIKIKGISTIYAFYPNYSQITIFVDNEPYEVVIISDESEHIIELPIGDKYINIVEGPSSYNGALKSVMLTSLTLDATKYEKIIEGDISERLIFLGDSITTGSLSTYLVYQGYAYLFRYEESKQVATLGWGGARIIDFAANSGLISTTVGWITDLFSNVTTTKKLIIELGTNDSISATDFETYYGNLLDAIHVLDATIKIFCISPLIRRNDGALLDSYRTKISDLCTAKSSFCTHIAGKTILTTNDLGDNVHPSTSGHKKLKDAIVTTILS